MRYRKHGTTLIAALLATIMVLSVFAMPAAATVDTEADFEVNADDLPVEDGDEDATETATIDFTNTDDGDSIIVAASDDSDLVDDQNESSVTIADVEVTDEDDFEDVDAEVLTGQTFSGIDDAFELTVVDDGDSDTADVEVEITLDIDDDITHLADDDNELDSETLFEVDDAEDVDSPDEGDSVATLTINPGEAVEFDLTSAQGASWDYDTDNDINADVIDAHDNKVGDYDTGDATVEIDGENIEREETEINIENGDIAETTIGTSEDIEPFVGDDITLEVSHDGGDIDADSEQVEITPDVVSVDFDENDITADTETGTDLEVELNDGDSQIEDSDIDEVDIALTLNDPNLDDVDIDTVDVEIEDLDQFDDTEANPTLTEVSVEENKVGDEAYSLTTTVAEEHEIEADILGVTGDDSVTVNSNNADSIEVDAPDDVQEFEEDDGITVNVDVEDEFGNDVQDPPGATPRIDVTVTGEEGNIEARENTLEDVEGGTTFDLTSGATGDDIEIAVGTLNIHIEDDIDGLDDEDTDSVTVVPDVLEVSSDSEDSEIIANETGEERFAEIDVAIDDDGADNLVSEGGNLVGDVDSVDVTLSTDASTLQDDASGETDFTVEIAGEQETLTDEGDVTTVTITEDDLTEEGDENEVAYNFVSQTAGEFDIEGELTDNSDTSDSLADEIEVEPAEIYAGNSDIEIEHEVIGTVDDPNNDVTVTLTLQDEFENNADYDGSGEGLEEGLEAEIQISDADILVADDADIDDGDFGSSIDGTDGEYTFDFNPNDTSDLDGDFETGDADLRAVADEGATFEDSDDLTVVHETLAFDGTYQASTIAQPAEVTFENVASEFQYNESGWDVFGTTELQSAEDYTAEDLHNGVLYEADDSSEESRVGYTFFDGSSTVTVGEVELPEDSFYLVGANFDLTDNTDKEIEEDLQLESIDPGTKDDIDDREHIRASEISGERIDGGSSVADDQGYWVRLIESAATEENEIFPENRGIVEAEYDASDRHDELGN